MVGNEEIHHEKSSFFSPHISMIKVFYFSFPWDAKPLLKRSQHQHYHIFTLPSRAQLSSKKGMWQHQDKERNISEFIPLLQEDQRAFQMVLGFLGSGKGKWLTAPYVRCHHLMELWWCVCWGLSNLPLRAKVGEGWVWGQCIAAANWG